MKEPIISQIVPEKSDPLLWDAACCGLTILDVMQLGLSPIAMKCSESARRVIDVMCDAQGYNWEWVPTEVWPPYEPWPWSSRMGEAVLTKVGK
jgi:hypothetical protein